MSCTGEAACALVDTFVPNAVKNAIACCGEFADFLDYDVIDYDDYYLVTIVVMKETDVTAGADSSFRSSSSSSSGGSGTSSPYKVSFSNKSPSPSSPISSAASSLKTSNTFATSQVTDGTSTDRSTKPSNKSSILSSESSNSRGNTNKSSNLLDSVRSKLSNSLGFAVLEKSEVTCSEMDVALKAIEAYEGQDENSLTDAIEGCVGSTCIPCVVRILPNGVFCWDEELAESTLALVLKHVACGVRKFLAQVSE